MAKCPICETENAADFGLVNCASCGSPFFVEIDGSASAPSAVAAPPPPPIFAAEEMIEAPIVAEEPPPLETPPLETPPPESPPLEDLREIAAFGNSEESLAREGAYRFTLYIGGIDTSEIRQEVRHQLSDSRFLWDIDALLSTINEGELIVNDISAVKAALAIQRLKLLPVILKWEQHAIHQSL